MTTRHKNKLHKKHADGRTLPAIWLMTDERFGGGLLNAVQRLPFGSGIIFRQYDLPMGERRRLFRGVRRICARRGHVLVLAGPENLARKWGACGFHDRISGRKTSGRIFRTTPVHDAHEMAQAHRMQADLIFLSPLFSTRSHPGARPLGPMAFMRLAQLAHGKKIIALGGMDRNRAGMLNKHHVHGWAGIDAFQK